MDTPAPPVSLDVTMTEADFSDKHLGVSGAIILAAFMSCKKVKDNGALSKLDISDSRIDEQRKTEIRQICDSKSITCLL